ncbi:MAG TPA: polysaccharide deacetylase family protein [Ktedonobacteraceae bacterium]
MLKLDEPKERQSMYMKILIAACFYYSGLVELRRWWIQQLGPRLIILNYHTAAGGDLRKHLLYLQRHYRLLHFEEALEELYSPSVPKRQDRRTPLAITFDDGYYDNYTHCLALACELHIPLTIFLIPGYIETGDRFWWLEPDYLVTHASVSEVTIEGQTYHLNTSKERAALAKAIDFRIHFASSVGERETYLKEVRQLLAVPYAVTLEEKSNLPISWAEVEAFKKSEWISFGSHTMHHPLLAYLTDPSESDYEVRESRTVLVQHLKSPVRSFAYPVGKFGDIGEQGVRSVQKAGYTWAVTTINGINTPKRNPYLLHRFGVDVGEHWLIIAAKASGVWNFFTNLARMKFLQKLRIGAHK